jgi:F-type H+-transporting ATPase subunit b
MTELLLLADLSPIKPDIGLILWTSLVFLFVWFTLGRLAFRPIQKALKQREDDIQGSLDEAKRVREEMTHLKAKNEELLAEAREERAMILKEAKAVKDNIINEAKDKAKDEARKIVTSAKEQIEHQKMAALTEVKNKVGLMAIEIAEKVLRKELSTNKDQETYVEELVDEFKLN